MRNKPRHWLDTSPGRRPWHGWYCSKRSECQSSDNASCQGLKCGLPASQEWWRKKEVDRAVDVGVEVARQDHFAGHEGTGNGNRGHSFTLLGSQPGDPGNRDSRVSQTKPSLVARRTEGQGSSTISMTLTPLMVKGPAVGPAGSMT